MPAGYPYNDSSPTRYVLKQIYIDCWGLKHTSGAGSINNSLAKEVRETDCYTGQTTITYYVRCTVNDLWVEVPDFSWAVC